MIPKIIHYCWFGRGKMSDLALRCIDSWRKYLPDYEMILWNEDNFDLHLFPYAEEAYQAKKYAFVTDVCRLYSLQEYGGLYMDTDVEILRPFSDTLLQHSAFSGFENNDNFPTGIMGSIKDGEWVNDLLLYYDNRSFFREDGSYDMTTNTHIITEFMKYNKGVRMDNTFQEVENYCTLYPSDYFCPKSWQTMEINITSNTYCIHHFAGSWLERSWKHKLAIFLFGKKKAIVLAKWYNKK
ncbi:glycosyltransferase family 32 protein [Sphingobacterium spiritivorum]|uniref:glycosyltransferase family 32 protein n=1 Tax=Sphingobacterium spiritivorum TaxID=258 RepID=UPI003DA696A5